MSVPGAVQSALGDEQVAAQISLGSEDQLFVTPSRTLIYRGEGILSDEAVEEYSHEADRVEVSKGRRKARITIHHDLEGERSFTVPSKVLDDALHPVLAGVLNAAGVTEAGETVKRTFRFSELTVIVTSRRLLNHIGEPVWDTDYEEYHFENATGLEFEEGSVATQVVLEVDGRRERIKAPNDQAPELRAELEEALFEFFDVDSRSEFERVTNPETDEEVPEPPAAPGDDGDDDVAVSLGGDISPLDAVGGSDEDETRDPAASGGSTGAAAGPTSGGQSSGGPSSGGQSSEDPLGEPTGAAGAGESAASAAKTPGDDGTGDATSSAPEAASGAGEPGGERTAEGSVNADTDAGESSSAMAADLDDGDAVSNEELAQRLDELTSAVKKQNELLETHAGTIEQLIEELKRMR
jgi:hypothetical protein